MGPRGRREGRIAFSARKRMAPLSRMACSGAAPALSWRIAAGASGRVLLSHEDDALEDAGAGLALRSIRARPDGVRTWR